MTNPQRNKLEIYDDVADEWWSDKIRWVRTLKNLVPARLAHFDRLIDWRDKQVLDVGCAGGFMAEALAQRGARVTGIDPAKDAIGAARAHAEAGGLDIRYDVGVGEALPYPSKSFDAVVCVDVLEHVENVVRVLQEVHRVLVPGGLLVFDTINRNPVSRFVAVTCAEDILRLLPKGTHDPEKFITPHEMQVAMLGAGLVPGEFRGLGPVGITRRGDFTFGRHPGTFIMYLGHGEKRV